ncbi:MAG: M56 family metallopeptidase [Gammaproteobacteria bacterium]|nr:M56 family metallopeptidase [Gammaproteobacteria bacterium]
MTDLSVALLVWGLVATVVASVLGALLYPLVRRISAGLSPSLRSSVRLAYVMVGPAAVWLALVVVSEPRLSSVLVPPHCHGELCGLHAPVYAHDSMIMLFLAAISSVVLMGLLALLLWALRRGQNQLRVLRLFTRPSGGGFRTLDSPELMAFCAGLWRPEVVVSQGLIAQLQPVELDIVLAHERAHCARYDNARLLLARWFTLLWPARLGNQVRSDIRADAEQACDLAAARWAQGTAPVAHAIRTLSALPSRAASNSNRPGVGFDCGDAAGRLAALESGYAARGSVLAPGTAFTCLAAYWCAHLCILTVLAHRTIEWWG